jgi:phosphopentomutase
MMAAKRAILIVMDGCGIGLAKGGEAWRPEGATLPNVARAVGGLTLPALERLGLGRVADIQGVSSDAAIVGGYGASHIRSAGKDSVTGHWEMAGIQTLTPFPTYPQGFPPEIIRPFEARIGRAVLGNVAASGTEIIQKYGAEHLATGRPIVYTSADSVFQIAAHERIVPTGSLYAMSAFARELLVAPHNVQRVIARPFIGSEEEGFHRTERRRDYPLPAPTPNLLQALADGGKKTHAIGVVAELFPGAPLARAQRTQSNPEHLAAIHEAVVHGEEDFVFANCEDFDMLYGHRNDPQGFAGALAAFDVALGEIAGLLRPGDLLLITADHGNDPTTPSTDHSREDVPLLAFSPSFTGAIDVGARKTLCDLAATVAGWLSIEWKGVGERLDFGTMLQTS